MHEGALKSLWCRLNVEAHPFKSRTALQASHIVLIMSIDSASIESRYVNGTSSTISV